MEGMFPTNSSKTFKKKKTSQFLLRETELLSFGEKLFSTPSLPSISLISR